MSPPANNPKPQLELEQGPPFPSANTCRCVHDTNIITTPYPPPPSWTPSLSSPDLWPQSFIPCISWCYPCSCCTWCICVFCLLSCYDTPAYGDIYMSVLLLLLTDSAIKRLFLLKIRCLQPTCLITMISFIWARTLWLNFLFGLIEMPLECMVWFYKMYWYTYLVVVKFNGFSDRRPRLHCFRHNFSLLIPQQPT